MARLPLFLPEALVVFLRINTYQFVVCLWSIPKAQIVQGNFSQLFTYICILMSSPFGSEQEADLRGQVYRCSCRPSWRCWSRQSWGSWQAGGGRRESALIWVSPPVLTQVWRCRFRECIGLPTENDDSTRSTGLYVWAIFIFSDVRIVKVWGGRGSVRARKRREMRRKGRRKGSGGGRKAFRARKNTPHF